MAKLNGNPSDPDDTTLQFMQTYQIEAFKYNNNQIMNYFTIDHLYDHITEVLTSPIDPLEDHYKDIQRPFNDDEIRQLIWIMTKSNKAEDDMIIKYISSKDAREEIYKKYTDQKY